jgi:hypothetical protein
VALGRLIEGFGLPQGTANSFLAKVRGALAALDRHTTAPACGPLGALANHARAQRGKQLTVAEADGLLLRVSGIQAALGCD